MKGRKRVRRRGARPVAKRKQDYRMELETGLYTLTEKKPGMTRRAPIADDLSDRINRLTRAGKKQLRHYSKIFGLERLAPPPGKPGAPKNPKPK
jgi:hypothetical protein